VLFAQSGFPLHTAPSVPSALRQSAATTPLPSHRKPTPIAVHPVVAVMTATCEHVVPFAHVPHGPHAAEQQFWSPAQLPQHCESLVHVPGVVQTAPLHL
jgi:hypothetical protein